MFIAFSISPPAIWCILAQLKYSVGSYSPRALFEGRESDHLGQLIN